MKLTQSQYLLWAGQALSPDVPLYNMPFRFDIHGTLDEAVFLKAFNLLVAESDAMRMVFVQDEENLPKSVVLKEGPGLEVIDATNQDDEWVQNWLEEKNERQFDLTEICYESVLLKRGPDQYLWYLNQHHLITDAWGISVQFKRMGEIYRALLTNSETGEVLPLFQNYTQHELKSRNQKVKKSYWEGELNALPPLPALYNYSQTRLSSASTRFFSPLSQEISDHFSQVLSEPDLRSFTTHISRFSAYMTCLMAYIYRVSGQTKIVVGTPSHNRSNKNFQNTPGVFIEFFPIIAEITDGESLGSLYQKVRNKVMSFLMNADSGMANPELSSSFNVVLNYIHAEFGDFAGIATDSEWLHVGHCDPRHDLRVHVMDYRNDGQGLIMFDMNDTVFHEKQGEAQEQFLKIFQQFIENRAVELDSIPLVNEADLSPTEGQSIESLSISSEFEMKEGDDHLSHQDILKRVGAIQKGLRESGVRPGDRVGLHLKRSSDFVCSVIAILQSRATYVPLPYNFPPARVQDMCEDADVAVLLTSSEIKGSSIAQIDPATWEEGSYEPVTLLSADCPHPAYIMYTSGSTGKPKGVEISHSNLLNYITYAAANYRSEEKIYAPLFTSIGFDLTATSVFLPVTAGGVIHVYPEPEEGPDLTVLDVVQNPHINWVKWTPSHMEMVKDKAPMPALKTMVVGGEDFKTELALSFQKKYRDQLSIINEYGPTEVTVGSIVHVFDPEKDDHPSVPIGIPMPHVSASVMNPRGLRQPDGVSGEIWLEGPAVSNGYWRNEERTNESFVQHEGKRYYRTGDLAYQDVEGVIHFQGRIDRQVKVGGRRMEPQEIARTAEQLAEIDQAVVALVGHQQEREQIINCASCGLPSNFPGVSFNEDHVCSLCENFDSYQERVKGYFKDRVALQQVFDENTPEEGAPYDCMMLLSGGKDSTYALAQLADMGLRVLAFTLDNGYISQGALDNARRVCQALGVDHVFGRTEHMNAIFVDSLKRFNNVCNGCFKVIYTLSTQIALEKKIPIIVTGLSRGQFFETRLTEELFWDEEAGPDKIDSVILNARKEYHRTEDAVSRLMDTSFFEDDDVFEKVKFVDFYRYSDVELGDLMTYLKEKLPWVRPSDTGRSTNCLINQVGIHVHKNNVGYSNYAFPYSWDVRIGHKNREESLDEINEEIDVPAVERIMAEIGYDEQLGRSDQHLTIFYKLNSNMSAEKLKAHLASRLPDFMVPWSYVLIDEVPLTYNGKVDYDTLIQKYRPQITAKGEYVAPQTDFEKMIAEIWEEVLLQDRISVHDKFLELGGNSLLAIRIISRMNKKFRLDLGLKVIFECPTITQLAEYVESEIRRLLAQMG